MIEKKEDLEPKDVGPTAMEEEFTKGIQEHDDGKSTY